MHQHKVTAARRALELVEPGMRVGLGTGSTAAAFVEALAERVAQGFDVLCVPTSEATAALAHAMSIPLTTLDETPFLDLAIDGADEIDSELRLIKGGGGALLREKIVAAASDRLVIIADDSKLVTALGRFPLPLEVTPFGVTATILMVEQLADEAGCSGPVTVRHDAGGAPFKTDGGNLILDCAFDIISEPEDLDAALKLIPGVLENGLFLGLADTAIVAGDGGVRVLEAKAAAAWSPDESSINDKEVK